MRSALLALALLLLPVLGAGCAPDPGCHAEGCEGGEHVDDDDNVLDDDDSAL